MRRTRLLELCPVATGLAGGMAFYKRFWPPLCFDFASFYMLVLWEEK